MKNDKIEEIMKTLQERGRFKNPEEVDTFFRQALHQQREDIWREAERCVPKEITKKKGVMEMFYANNPRAQQIREETNMDVGYNQALADTLANMKSAQTLHDNEKGV